jgi:hypothetical protein
VVVRRFLVGVSVLTLGACQSEKDAKLELLKSDLELVRTSLQSCDDAEIQLEREEGDVAQAQWDVAAAENVDSIDPDQEAEARESLGDRMSIAPSKVDLKGTYQSRADAGKAKLGHRNYTIELAQQQVDRSCKNKGKDQQRAWDLEDEIKRMGGIV